MAKNPVGASDTTASLHVNWGAFGIAVISVLLAVFAWLALGRLVDQNAFTQQPATWIKVLLLASSHAALTFGFERILARTPSGRARRYRLAFALSVTVSVVHIVLLWVGRGNLPNLGWLVVAVAGAFTGGLLATGYNDCLWEDNSPPSEQLKEEVRQYHHRILSDITRTPATKRTFDICLALAGLVVSLPVWLLGAFLVWIEDPGPLLFVKNSVGKNGINFHQYKFRTMVFGAEDTTGPVMAREEDARVLLVGRLLRKTALDELPQLLNILRGEMSFVGPRPQRTVLVQGYLEELPEYAERHRVLPGLAGLAQVAGNYYLTPRQKLRFDRLYIRYSGLGFDLKLIWLAFLVAFWLRWQPGWDGRLPRRWLHS
jgi:lipopolysaccharide/colanic/teichoic acid biosynthesis glycosyltransferase